MFHLFVSFIVRGSTVQYKNGRARSGGIDFGLVHLVWFVHMQHKSHVDLYIVIFWNLFESLHVSFLQLKESMLLENLVQP